MFDYELLWDVIILLIEINGFQYTRMLCIYFNTYRIENTVEYGENCGT